jgi:hypothetical protein
LLVLEWMFDMKMGLMHIGATVPAYD